MINTNLKRKSSEPGNCWRTSFSDAGKVNTQLISRKAAKHVRQKRLELRRLKSRFSNKIKLENEDETMNRIYSPLVISLSYNTMEASSSSEIDVSVSRVTSSRSDTTQTARAHSLADTCGSYGKISVIGRRREMEDAVTVELGFVSASSRKYDFFGVYDGHGGSRVAHACRDRLHHLVVKEVEEEETVDWEKVMVASFGKMDEEVIASGAVTGSIGSTAVVAVVGEEVVVVANCGDSRAVLSRARVPMPLSNDHKPDRPDELERIEVSGGRVINWNGQRVLGVLATSRSIGDQYLKPYVIAQPEVTVSKRNDTDEFLILASDGLWDVITNELACRVVRKCLDGRLRRRFSQGIVNEETSGGHEDDDDEIHIVNDESRAIEAAAVLAELAMARGSKDNISVVVVELNKPPGQYHQEEY